jgi:hypothetical protein
MRMDNVCGGEHLQTGKAGPVLQNAGEEPFDASINENHVYYPNIG